MNGNRPLIAIIGGMLVLLLTGACATGSDGGGGQAPDRSKASNAAETEVAQTHTRQVRETTITPVSPTEIASSIYSFPTGRTIWLHREGENHFQVFSIDTGEINLVPSPRECSPGPLPQRHLLICLTPTGNSFSYDLRKQARTDIPLPHQDWARNSADGRFAYFGENKDLLGGESISSYDVDTGMVQEIIHQYDLRGVSSIAAVSPDKKHIATVRQVGPHDYRVFEIDSFSTRFTEVGIDNPETTLDTLLWSPKDPLLLYGATDVQQEIAPKPNFLYLLDFRTMENSLLSEAPDQGFYSSFINNPAWSPAGDRIAAIAGTYLCILQVDAHIQECYRNPAYEIETSIGGPEWSPAGDKVLISFIQPRSWVTDIVVFDVATAEYHTVLRDVGIVEVYFWR